MKCMQNNTKWYHQQSKQQNNSIVSTCTIVHPCIGRAIQASLKGDRRRRVEEAGLVVKALLKEDPPNAKEAWRRMKRWYQAAAKRGPPPARGTLERITAERTELYSRVPSPGENIPVTVDPALIDNSVPTEDEIADAVKKLRRTRSGGHRGSVRSTSRGGSRRPRGGGWRRRRGKRRR